MMIFSTSISKTFNNSTIKKINRDGSARQKFQNSFSKINFRRGKLKTYGSPRILEKLKDEGEAIGKHRVARIMRENGIQGAAKKKFKPQTTDSNHQLPVTDRIFETENSDIQCTSSVWDVR